MHKNFKSWRSPIYVFSFFARAFGVISKNPLPNLRSWRLNAMFVPKSFIVLALTLRYLIHFEWSLYMMWSRVQVHSFAFFGHRFSQNHWSDCYVLTEWSHWEHGLRNWAHRALIGIGTDTQPHCSLPPQLPDVRGCYPWLVPVWWFHCFTFSSLPSG